MTNAPPAPGSGGAPPTSYAQGPTFSSMPRRFSYASVAASPAQNLNPHFPPTNPNVNVASSTPTNSSFPPQYQSDGLYNTYSGADMQQNGGWRRGYPLPQYSRQFINSIAGPEFVHGATSPNPFFTPSYLKSSKYVSQLAAAHKSKTSTQKDNASNHSSNAPSLSTSSSNANLQRIAPSHRGMTYDIVEHHPPTDDDVLNPLPSRWNETDKYVGLDLIGDGLEVRYLGQASKHEHEAAAARADHPMPPQCGIYYFEVTIMAKSKEGMIGVGFSSSKASLERLPGWEQESWAYHGDDGKTFFGDNQGQGKPYGPTFTVNDTIGCGVNFSTGCAFFTKNGIYLGNAFRELKNVKLYPSVGMKKNPGAHVKANFGQYPFVFDIDGMMAKEKSEVLADISKSNISCLSPKHDETSFMQELVAQFLVHGGYVETARAFANEVREESRDLRSDRESSLRNYEAGEDIDGINRQKIRSAILDGDIDKALKYTNAYYPNVLQDHPQIYFRLRCRKFIEMMRRSTEPQLPTPSGKRTRSSNGAGPNDTTDPDPVFTTGANIDLELDEAMEDVEDSTSDGGAMAMDMEEVSDYGMKCEDLLTEALVYGRQLRADYPGDERKEYKKMLDDIFSLFAYADPRSSVHGYLLDPSGRVPVAEELNSAILVSLGKSSSAALERLYQQTEVLVNDVSEEGGAGAFINVRNDFLV